MIDAFALAAACRCIGHYVEQHGHGHGCDGCTHCACYKAISTSIDRSITVAVAYQYQSLYQYQMEDGTSAVASVSASRMAMVWDVTLYIRGDYDFSYNMALAVPSYDYDTAVMASLISYDMASAKLRPCHSHCRCHSYIQDAIMIGRSIHFHCSFLSLLALTPI